MGNSGREQTSSPATPRRSGITRRDGGTKPGSGLSPVGAVGPRRHLRALTRNTDRRAFTRETVPATIRRLVESLNQPACVTGRRWDVLAWNAAAAEIFAFDRIAEEDRNTLLAMLTNPRTRRLFGDAWADEARRMVAQFRATHDLWAGDPAFLDLLDRLRRGRPEFATWWGAHDIKSVAARQKLLAHPKKGALRFEYASFQANDDPALKLVIYLYAGARPPRELRTMTFPLYSKGIIQYT